MFNIRGIIKRRNDQTKSPESRISEDGVESSSSSAEGFLCPLCFQAFPSPDDLQTHYESSHSENSATLLPCPACKMKLGSEIELQSHYVRHHSDKKEGFEIEAMGLQVKALEEGKALLQDELQAVRLQSSELLKENVRVRGERDGLELKAAKLAGEAAELKAELDETKTKKQSAETSLRQAEDRIRKLEIEIQQRPEADDVTLLQQELVSVQKMMDQLTLQREAEKAQIQKHCDEISHSKERLQAEKSQLENLHQSCPKKEEVNSLQEKLSQLNAQISQLRSDLQSRDAEKKRLLEKFGNYDELKALLARKDKEYQDVLKASTDKDGRILKLESDLKTSKESVENMKAGREKLFSKIEEGEGASVAILQLKEENARLQEQFLQQQTLYSKTAHDNEIKLEDLRSAIHKANYELQVANEKNKEFEGELSDCREQLSNVRLEKDSLVQELKLQIANLSSHDATVKAKLHSLQEELKMKNKFLDELKFQSDTLKKKLEKEQSSAIQMMEMLELEKNALKKELAESSEKLEESVEKLTHEKSALEAQLKALQVTLEETKLSSDAVRKEFCDKISSLSEELMQAQFAQTELKDQLQSAEELKTELQEKCLSLDEEIKNLRLSLTSLQNEKNSLLSELEEERKKGAELTKTQESLHSELNELMEATQKEKKQAEQIRRDLSISKDMYLKAKVEWQQQKENLENDCAKQLSQIQETVKQLENQVEEAEEKSASLNIALEESGHQLAKKEREWEAIESRLQARVAVLEENAKTLGEDLVSEKRKTKDLQEKVDELSGLKLELQAKLENALDERRGLLERCLRGEGELEHLQNVYSEMRRKHEDCVAALQELGRENQTLQVENLKHMTRKWADDAEVTHCTTCGKLFTVTIRKHHCRNCGNIFCNECSAKTATVAASKKPVRVCELCYEEVTK